MIYGSIIMLNYAGNDIVALPVEMSRALIEPKEYVYEYVYYSCSDVC